MEKLREALSTSSSKTTTTIDTVLTWGGTETVIIFDLAHDLEHFAAFTVPLQSNHIQTQLEEIFYDKIAALALQANIPLILDAATWRASSDYLTKLGFHSRKDMLRVNQAAVDAMYRIKGRWREKGLQSIVSAELGPRGDGYQTGDILMSAAEAEAYHMPQIEALKVAGVELINAYTLTYTNEALGIAIAASKAGVPLVLSATVETNGKLPDQTSLGDFIMHVDTTLESGGHSKPLYFMINCAHPSHVEHVLDQGEGLQWRTRIKGMRANASKCSHAELDEATQLDNGDPEDFGRTLAEWNRSKGMLIVGGCCGTDYRHIECIVTNLS